MGQNIGPGTVPPQFRGKEMRYKCLLALVMVIFLLFVGACTGQPERPAPTISAAPTTTTTDPNVLQMSQEDLDAAFNYYVSPERRHQLQEVLDTLGMQLAQGMLAGRIPSATYGLNKKTPAPVNGYGMLHSLPNTPDSGGKPYVEVLVEFVNGKIDLRSGVLSLFIVKDDVIYTLNGAYSMNRAGELVANTPSSYEWRRDGECLFISYADRVGIPDDAVELDPSTGYEISGFSGLETATSIKVFDNEFVTALNFLGVKDSDWK
ncbi:MAG TPA: hypothetical protein VFZ58_01020 [Candidatus Saccharimonadales bacterium]